MAQGPMSSILVTIRITIWIQESQVRNPDSLDYRKSYQRILMKFYGDMMNFNIQAARSTQLTRRTAHIIVP